MKSVLEMWFSGEEGGTSTARLLLGLANPSGHTDITWPANATDTIWGYNETVPLYAGDTTGPHLERLNNGPNGTTDETEGIFNGYRFFDKEGITPMFPFGWGLSYTRFSYTSMAVSRATDGGLKVSVRVKNTGAIAGSAVPQVYLGAPSQQPAGVQFAVRQLVQFGRVTLNPGQSQHVTVHVPLRELQYWSTPASSGSPRAARARSTSATPTPRPACRCKPDDDPVVQQHHVRQRTAQRSDGARQRDRSPRRLVRPGRHLSRRERERQGRRAQDRRLDHRGQPHDRPGQGRAATR